MLMAGDFEMRGGGKIEVRYGGKVDANMHPAVHWGVNSSRGH